jgi:hypothetical protein
LPAASRGPSQCRPLSASYRAALDEDTGRSGTSDEERGARISGDVAGDVVLGVDTHLDFHVAVALDRLGRRLGEVKVPTTA